MKILITTDCYKPMINGVVTSIINLENQLRKQGNEVKILCPSEDIHCDTSENVYKIGSIGASKIYGGARAAFRMSQKNLANIIEWKPDIIHSQSEFTSFIMAKKVAKAVGCPIVHTYHTVYENYTHYFSPSKTIGKKAAKLFTRKIIDNVQEVIAPSGKIEKMLINYGITKIINIIPTGLDLKKFQEEKNEKTILKLKEELNIPRENKVLITVGRAAREKNIDEIISSFGKMNLINTTLLIIGGGPYLEELKELAKEIKMENEIKFTGMVLPENIPNYYKLGDIFVSGSTSETQGLTYIEAMASGLPLICREDECLKGVIENGVNGYCYKGYNEFKKAIGNIFENKELYIKMSENACKRAEKYSIKAFGESVIETYEETIKYFNEEKSEKNEIENSLYNFKNCG